MKKRGRGIACTYFGMGNTAAPNPSSAFVEVCEDGTAIVRCGASDVGQGSDTVLGQIAAEALGITSDRVTMVSHDTMFTPEAGISSASRQTYVSGNAIRLAAEEAKAILLREAAECMDRDPRDFEARDNRFYIKTKPESYITVEEVCTRLRRRGILVMGTGTYNPPTSDALDSETGLGIPYGAYSYATQIAEVEVDTETGEVTVLSLIAAQDVGRAINPMAVEGQIQGGVAHGIGYALMEEVVVVNGIIQNPSFSDLLIPTSLDVPPIHGIIVEEPEPTGPFGAKGTGEPPACPTAAAVINAVYDAVGIEITSTPVTAEKVWLALKSKERKESREDP
jgi:nicotinate dehydrogenase medium molybdopterin subunit